MATALLAGTPNTTQDTPLYLDATVSITINRSSTITKHPVEGGSNISDHVFRNNNTIDIECLISDNVIGGVNNLDDFGQGAGRTQRVYDMLSRMHDNRELVTVVSDLEVFRNCVINKLSTPRTEEFGSSAMLSIGLEQLQLVSSQITSVDTTIFDSNQPNTRKNGLSRNSNNPDNSEEDKGHAERALDWLAEIFPSTATEAPTLTGEGIF